MDFIRWIYSWNLYKHNPKLDDWAKNSIKHDVVIKPEKRGVENSYEFSAIVDGIHVWVGSGWHGFQVIPISYTTYYDNNWELSVHDYDNELGRPRLDLALRLWWKIKKEIKNHRD